MDINKLDMFNLIIETSDEAAEITILDSQFQRVELDEGKKKLYKSSERMVVPLEVGLYTVKVVVAGEVQEKSVALLNQDEIIHFPPTKLFSPAPLEESVRASDYQTSNAVHESYQVHLAIGKGSQIYIFARIQAEPSQADTSSLKVDPAIGLTFRNAQDQVLVDLGNPQIGKYTTDRNPWSACNIELDPGIYCLCLETNSEAIFKRSIVASPGWQTQVFLQENDRNTYLENDRSASNAGAFLSKSSIFMAPVGHGFNATTKGLEPNDQNLRLTEIARQALVNGRLILSEEHFHQMLDEKFNNPMLGIYGCHLLLKSNQSRYKSTMHLVVKKLRTLLRSPHPDVEAIALNLNMDTDYVFTMPPMLRQSWGLILEASVKRPEIIQEDSLISSIAGQILSSDQWLVWSQSASQLTNNNDFVTEQIKKLLDPEEWIPQNSDIFESVARDNSQQRLSLEKLKNDDEKMTYLVKSFGIPRSKLDSIISSID